MFLAHAAHTKDMMEMSTMDSIDHCMPIIIGAGIIIAILIAVIVYLLTNWHPNNHVTHNESKKSKKK